MGLRTGSISIGGLASGIQSDELITRLLELERRPIDLLETQKTDFGDKLDIIQDLNTKALSLRNALRAIDNMVNVTTVYDSDGNRTAPSTSSSEEFSRFKTTSSDSTIVTAIASGNAQPSNLSLQVRQLALAEREVSTGFADVDTTTIGTGTFSVTINSVTTAITVDSTNNTLEGFADAINDSGAAVRAFIINDGDATSPYRVAIESTTTGAAQAIDVTTGTTASLTSTLIFAESQTASDATIRLDPNSANFIDITSSTNTFTDLVKGVTVTAHKADTTAVETVEVAEDADTIVTNIQALVSAYNDIVDIIATQNEVDPETNRGGPLIGDSTLVSFQRQLSAVVASQIGTGTFDTSGSVGLSLDRDGTLKLDEDDLRSALASDFTAAGTFFAGLDSFSDKMRVVVDSYSDPVEGRLITRIEGINTSITRIDNDILSAEARIDEVEARLIRQFAALERAIAGIQQQTQFLTAFVNQQQSR